LIKRQFMQARLSAVQQALIVVTIVAFVIAALVHPAPDNADYRRALAELTSLKERFDRTKVEALLLEHAEAQGRQPLDQLTRQVIALRPIKLQVAQPVPSIEPLASVKVTSLADIEHYAQQGVTLPIAVADLSSVASGLAWRIARELAQTPTDAALTLRSAELQVAPADAAGVALETQVAELQSEQQAARGNAERAGVALTEISKLYENRVKWRVGRQLRNDTYKQVLDARKAQRDAERALRDATKRYEGAVSKAALPTKQAGAAMSEYGVVQVELGWPAGPKRYAIPVAVKTQQAQLAPLQGANTRYTRAAGLWDDVKNLDLDAATDVVSQRFNWHYRGIDLAGVKLGGVTVLQLTPCVLPLLLLLLLARMREVAGTYNPFRTRVKTGLPRVGFRTRILDALAIVVLPLTAAVFAVASLMLVGQLPALPLLAAVACLLLGAYAFHKLGELQELMEDVVRSHSNPPPAEQPAPTTTP
jgi:hypothetical protein